MKAPRLRVNTVLLLTCIAACSDGTGLLVRNQHPMLALLLSRPPVDAAADTAPLTTILVTTGTPTAATYLTADAFSVRRERDGKLLDWHHQEIDGPIPTYSGDIATQGNYVLANVGEGGKLGRSELTGGDRYILEVTAGGSTIHGDVVLPEDIHVSVAHEGDSLVARWNRSRGAVAYEVTAATEARGSTTRDTSYVLRLDQRLQPLPDTATLFIVAVDTNYYRFAHDTLVASSGLAGALGVFGAFAEARVAFQIPAALRSVARPATSASSRAQRHPQFTRTRLPDVSRSAAGPRGSVAPRDVIRDPAAGTEPR